LTAEDNGLSIKAFSGEQPILSGGVQLSDLQWTPAGQKHEVQLSPAQLATLPAGIPALRINGKRVTRARFPNADPERDMFPIGYISGKTNWRPPVYPPYNVPDSKPCTSSQQCGVSTNLTVDSAVQDDWKGIFENYTVGVGGACEVFEPPRSPWCSGAFYTERMRGGGLSDLHYRAPSGIVLNTTGAGSVLPHGPYRDPSGAHVFAWRPAHWYTWIFKVGRAEALSAQEKEHGEDSNTGEANKTGQSLLFTGGGNQGGEGADYADEWFIDGVEEELDAPNEFYFDATAGKLLVYFNSTVPHTVVVPTRVVLLQVVGTKAKPVRNVTIAGLEFRDTRPTYLDPRTTPSGGDWALERTAAVVLDGTTGCTVARNNFHHLDSNALLLSAYNRNTSIVHNEFAWLGQSAIAAWGRLDNSSTNSGMEGNQPRGTIVDSNFCHEIGHYQVSGSKIHIHASS
jgi:hypothetical protein